MRTTGLTRSGVHLQDMKNTTHFLDTSISGSVNVFGGLRANFAQQGLAAGGNPRSSQPLALEGEAG